LHGLVWWDTDYLYRRQLTIKNNSSSDTLFIKYSVECYLNTAALVTGIAYSAVKTIGDIIKNDNSNIKISPANILEKLLAKEFKKFLLMQVLPVPT